MQLVRRLRHLDKEEAAEAMPVTPENVFQLLSQAAKDCNLEHMAYEFFAQAFVVYEEEVADSKAQVTAIHVIIGSLQRMTILGDENRDTLTHKATGYSAKLLKKPDQCRAVYACSHLFWMDNEEGIKDGERVLLCLKRALRIANAAQQITNVARGRGGPVTLFVEILNKYLYFYERDNEHITIPMIQSLLDTIKTEKESDSTVVDRASAAFYSGTIRYILSQKQKGGVVGEKYGPINVG